MIVPVMWPRAWWVRPDYIRDSTGILVSFPKIQYHSGQDERYENELREQNELAEYLVEQLKARAKQQHLTNKPKAREKSKIRAKKPRTTNENTPLKQFVDKFNRL